MTLIVSRKGQVTLRRSVLEHLGIEPGQAIDLQLLPNARLELSAAARRHHGIGESAGMLKRENGPTLSIEELTHSIAAGWARHG